MRNTARRDKHRAIIKADRPPCHVCKGEYGPIDYDAHHLSPLSFTIDHITPLALGGEDTLDNLAAAHRRCNRAKSAKPSWRPGVRYVTGRRWTRVTAGQPAHLNQQT